MLLSLLPFSVRVAAYRRRFVDNRGENLFLGSFETFKAAAAGVARYAAQRAPEDPPLLDIPQVNFSDYPSVFWLGRAFGEGMRSVFELGGQVGVKFYAFRRMLSYPADLRWTVCESPDMVRQGREMAEQRQVSGQLNFTTQLEPAGGHDVLYASGSLPYLPARISEILAALPSKPKRIILNSTAVHPDRTLYTLHSTGSAVAPYRIQHHDELLAELTTAGYRRRDGWRNEGRPIQVPFVDGGEKPYYAGYCFDLF
ncbi:MAG TPA: methyltransferase, TIGR04325 family [Variovorax sp.]